MWLVVGLGNPGRTYEDNRHNSGFLVVRELARRWGVALDRPHLGARTGKGSVAGQPAVLALPQSFMNASGQPVASLKGWYRIAEDRLLIVHDDLDLAFGTVRVRHGGGHGGHNGLRDIQTHLGTAFARVRVGISRPPAGWDPADWVLSNFTTEERARLDDVVGRAANAVETVLEEGVTAAMNRCNTRSRRAGGSGSSHPPEGEPARPSSAESPPAAEPDDASPPTLWRKP
ncbi:MAG: aminoacyl-tRNA hydrolase [Deltaproteobacteria bacterium]|nr:aminoacyl-tRNA hydrolase [Deltaproteobacteria bacterium]